MNHVLLCADDYGMYPAIDQAILQLVALRRLSAFSCMVLSPGWPQAASHISPLIRSRAYIGLHLDFTEFLPDAIQLPNLIGGALLRRLSPSWLRQCIWQQLDRFTQATGTLPDYIDGHRHVHQLPQVREAMLEAVENYFPRQKPWIRIARTLGYQGCKAVLISMLGASTLTRLCRQMQLTHTHYLLGIYDFSGGEALYGKRMIGWLARASSNPANQRIALMCHPAIPSDQPHPNDPIQRARVIEFALLSSDQLPTLLSRYNLQLTLVDGSRRLI